MPYGRKKCDGGMDYNTALGYCIKTTLKCKVETTTCYKWVECPFGGPSEKPPPVLSSRRRRMIVTKLNNGCSEFHALANIVCCQYECRERGKGTAI